VKTIFYPIPYCPNEKVVVRLEEFVRQGGQLYVSGDISYDGFRRRTKTRRLIDLCGVEFVSERYANVEFQSGAIPVQGKAPGWPDYVAAPGIVTRLAGASVLVESHDGHPVVTKYLLGDGCVIFSADPIELHGDPRYQPYAHEFYRALCDQLRISGEKVDPTRTPVHCFRVPSQDQREIMVLVNHSETETAHNFHLSCSAGDVSLTLQPRLSGAVVVGKDNLIQAVEGSADVRVNRELLAGSDLHFMAISLTEAPLESSSALLLLPMGEGHLRIAGANRWKRPVALVGEIAAARWTQYESFLPEQDGGMLKLPVTSTRSFSMILMCESAHQSVAVKQIETWVNQPWLLAS
jgi:hypothetical protein